ncbi:TatD DNase family Scn1 [Coprinopsis cinerea okayama7|uniref:TatD DNase family Scn1 n=1 Tax=Coprinopsis cinerea (strain Okayama-7 / 130 / ATCC MYA-4618 / FGSC 9003) TaxID=240176 RepID=A8N340_COPC7|nr:TatD DNase family Scn1 [Coprinopsis cinerea okayama7\|eukprot:XP_001829212.1 TatD DNase family Scn1 [Coprinopsis cinerea okayama7\
MSTERLLPPDVLKHVVDVHCHPTDAPEIPPEAMDELEITICAMSSMKSDQKKVAELARSYPSKVVPCFGYHPWFSYQIAVDPALSKEDHYRRLFLGQVKEATEEHTQAFERLVNLLPEPTPLSSILDEVRAHLIEFPDAMVGEVGLDRVFRVPYDYFAEKRELTPFIVPLEHQLTILEAQLELAVELGRNVSIHSVKSQLATLELLSKLATKHGNRWYRISIDMHSCGLSPQMWRDTEKKFTNIFLSLSTVINGRHSNCRKLLQVCSDDRILSESDFNDVRHVTDQTVEIIQLIAEVKGWSIEQEWDENVPWEERGVVRRLKDNWERFKKGGHRVPESKRRRAKKLLDSGSEGEE